MKIEEVKDPITGRSYKIGIFDEEEIQQMNLLEMTEFDDDRANKNEGERIPCIVTPPLKLRRIERGRDLSLTETIIENGIKECPADDEFSHSANLSYLVERERRKEIRRMGRYVC